MRGGVRSTTSRQRTKKALRRKRIHMILQVHTARAVYCQLGDEGIGFVRRNNRNKETTRAANSWETRVGESASVRRVCGERSVVVEGRTNTHAQRGISPRAICELTRAHSEKKSKANSKCELCELYNQGLYTRESLMMPMGHQKSLGDTTLGIP